MGLIGMGAPEEEYEAEVSLVVSRMKSCESVESLQTMIHEIFVGRFDESSAGTVDRYKSVAERIWALNDTVWVGRTWRRRG